MKCYRRKGGFGEHGNPDHCTDRVRVRDDGSGRVHLVEFIYESGLARPAQDPAHAAAMARANLGDGLWEECEDQPFKKEDPCLGKK